MTQDRTRAIVQAAEEVARAMQLEISKHGAVAYVTPAEEYAVLEQLARAIALPVPTWSKDPPQRSGDYFVCSTERGAAPFVTHVRGTLGAPFYGKLSFLDQRGMAVPVTSLGYVWWPIEIEKPEAP